MTELSWNQDGLLPAIAQDRSTGAILMLAWMNKQALEATQRTGYAHFYSRSRGALWKKGETSGNTLKVVEIRTDCDDDTLMLIVEPAGPACHTGKPTCFFRPLRTTMAADRDPPPDNGHLGAPSAIIDRVANVLCDRRDHATTEKSYTRSLFEQGIPKIVEKIDEEARELAIELPTGDRQAVVHETADLIFHVLVGLVARDIPPAAVWVELERRFGVSGHTEKASRGS